MDYKKDYYGILGVDEKATTETLRAAYRQLAKQYHPDKNPDNPDAEERFKAINEAYEVLSNEITRSIYDAYRDNDKREKRSEANEEQVTYKYKPRKKTKTRTYNVLYEKRIYVSGTIDVKFQGTPDIEEVGAFTWEKHFTIIPTEVLVTFQSSDIYNEDPPEVFESGYSSADIFTAPLKQPLNCKIITNGQEEYYQLHLYDLRIKNPVLTGITRHEPYSFGTFHSILFGYLLHRHVKEVTEEYEEHREYSGATGKVETKVEAGHVFTTEQHYAANGNTYWTEWRQTTRNTGNYTSRTSGIKPVVVVDDNDYTDLLCLIALIIMMILWPPLLFIVLPVFGVLILASLLGDAFIGSNKLAPWLGILLVGFIALIAMQPLFQKPRGVSGSTVNKKLGSIRSKKTIIKDQTQHADTLITHNIRWQDRDSSQYNIQLSITSSALRKSAMAHKQMEVQPYASHGIGSVYKAMLATDNAYLNPIAGTFDSLALARHLTTEQKASMVVSCIQSIPYSLIVDKSCTAHYADAYINQYLTYCKTDCCKGYAKFGVQSPLEFLGDLKGDCDTRALFLYGILGKLGYHVALLTSDYYKHALIAVKLEQPSLPAAAAIRVNNQFYYLWETTSKAFGPGALPVSLSDITHWKITLIQ